MPTKVEKDKHSGQPTTGHEWDGIKELNTPLPRWWVWVFLATVIWAVGYWVVYPAWPLLDSYTRGTADYSSRQAVEEDLAQAQAGFGEMKTAITQTPLSEIRTDPELFAFAFASGRSAYAVNCSQCHGLGAQGAPGIPNLNDDAWIWGGDLQAIYQTIRYGIRSDHPETRVGEMPAFGELGLLSGEEIESLADFVLSLSGDPDFSSQAAELYLNNCSACHGENGEGLAFAGAPRLSDPIWLYGGRRQDIIKQIENPSHGVMPAWEDRLSAEVIKELAIYVHGLGGGE